MYSLDPENKERYAQKEKQWADKYEDDLFDKLMSLFKKNDPGLEAIHKKLRENVINHPNKNVSLALSDSLSRTRLKRWDKPNSRFDATKQVIMVSRSADDKTVAHELFHEMDERFEISKKRKLLGALETDSELLRSRAVPYRNDVGNMIQSLYPDEFVSTEAGRVVIKEGHRGLSGILHGLSYGKIDMGYGHRRPGYWDKSLNIERETWAQIGRSLYQNDPKGLEMLKILLPSTYEEVLRILKGVAN